MAKSCNQRIEGPSPILGAHDDAKKTELTNTHMKNRRMRLLLTLGILMYCPFLSAQTIDKCEPKEQSQPATNVDVDKVLVSRNMSGIVKDKGGSPVANVLIRIYKAKAMVPVDTLCTDSNGSFSAMRLPPGPYNLTLSKTGFATMHFRIRTHPAAKSKALVLTIENDL